MVSMYMKDYVLEMPGLGTEKAFLGVRPPEDAADSSPDGPNGSKKRIEIAVSKVQDGFDVALDNSSTSDRLSQCK